MKKMSTVVALSTLLPLALVLSGCGGGGGSITDGGNNRLSETNPRIKSVSVDYSQDGSVDLVQTYFYDNSGRISRIESQDIANPGAGVTTKQYEYTDNKLTRVSDGNNETTYTYENGLLTAISDSDGAQRTLRYDNSGSLLEHTENSGADCDRDPGAQPADNATTHVFSYTGNRVVSINAADGTISAALTYNDKNQIKTITTTEDCGNYGERDEVILSYDSRGLASTVDYLYYTLPDNTLMSHDRSIVTRDDQGRVVSVVERDQLTDTVLQTRNRTYGNDGLPTTDTVIFTNQTSTFFVYRDTTVTYAYEDASCVISYTADPTRLVILDSILPWSNYAEEPALLCGYPLD